MSDPALEPMDETDAAILRELREIVGRLDPCPAGLADRVKFALTVKALHAEVAELISTPQLVLRGAAEEEAEASTVTFSTDTLSIMVSTAVRPDGTVGLDGWLTCGSADVEIQVDGGVPVATAADADGRFAVDGLPRGSVRITVRRPGGRPVVTAPFTI